jgi:hypothetical protein
VETDVDARDSLLVRSESGQSAGQRFPPEQSEQNNVAEG